MKFGSKLGSGGVKEVVTQHAEKAIFGVVLALVAFFIYSSATEETIPSTRSPDDLKVQAATARRHLGENFWDNIKVDRESKVKDFPERAKEARKPIDEAGYTLPNVLDKELIPKRSMRRDPAIMKPIQIEAEGAVLAVAMRARRGDVNWWAGDRPAVVRPPEEDKPKRRPRRKKRRVPSSDEDELYSASEDGEDYNYEEEEEEVTTTATGVPRTLDDSYKEHFVKGYRGGAGRSETAGVVAKPFGVVSVKALVPYEKQWREYESALANAKGYIPSQDIPRYLSFVAERAEVPDDPNAPLQWKTISYTSYAMAWSNEYAATVEEIADADYCIPNVLTMPIPPILLKSYDSLALHSEIPRQQVSQVEETPEETPPPGEVPSLEPGNLEEAMGRVPAGERRYSSEDSDEYSEEDEYPDEDEGGYRSGYGYDSDYDDGDVTQQPLVKYKMVRFFDLTAEPGKSYRYRVALVLEDPNRPQNPAAQPSLRILDADAAQRLAKQEAEDAADTAYLQKYGRPKRTYYRQTDWSEPSSVVTLLPPDQFVGGPVTKGKTARLPEGTRIRTADASGSRMVDVTLARETEVQTTGSVGKLVAVVWDPQRAAEIPAECDVQRGSFLSFDKDLDALHPLTLQIRTIQGFSFHTGAFVADFRGGEELITDVEGEGRDKTTTVLSTPGEFLVVDGKGNLVACDEIDDVEEYRRLLLIPDKPAPEVEAGAGEEYGSDEGMEYDEEYDEEDSSDEHSQGD